MSAIRDAKKVAIVSSPSSNYEVALDILDTAIHEPLVGSMLFVETPLGEGRELALGTVTEVTTRNQWHENSAMRGVVRSHGHIPGMSGDSGDVRAATMKLQACYGTVGDGTWTQSGPSLRMSPPTAAPIRTVTNDVITELMAGEDDLHYLGNLHRSDVKVPLSIRDFSGDRGAFHTGVFGQSGSGKSVFASVMFMGQMRHADHGMIIIDPQGQWASETGLPYSLQGFAAEMGREVLVRRVSEDLRLEKDAPLFGDLISKTRFLRELMKMSAETQEIITDEIVKILRNSSNDWTEQSSPDLMDDILRGLREPDVLRRVYADGTRQIRLMLALSEVLGDLPEENPDGTEIPPGSYSLPAPQVLARRQKDVLAQFAPLHNLFARTNPGGGTRHSLWGTISHVFDKAARHGAPAPLVVLDMSTSGQVSWLKDLLADEDAREAMESLKILDQDPIKAAILRQTCRTLKTASEAAFRDGETLNTQVVFDEAWRYAPPPAQATDPEIKALSQDLAGYARDTRKFGIGWTFISQSPRSIAGEIWDQMSVRVLGYGLAGADLAKAGEQLDDADHLKLYKGFSPPDSTNPKVYPFMILGPVSPLSFSRAPLAIQSYTSFDEFRADNHEWIEQARLAQGKSVLTGLPARPGTGAPAPVRRAPALVSNGRVPAQTTAQMERIRANRETGGVDTSVLKGLSTDPGFSSGLGAIDDDYTEPPF